MTTVHPRGIFGPPHGALRLGLWFWGARCRVGGAMQRRRRQFPTQTGGLSIISVHISFATLTNVFLSPRVLHARSHLLSSSDSLILHSSQPVSVKTMPRAREFRKRQNSHSCGI